MLKIIKVEDCKILVTNCFGVLVYKKEEEDYSFYKIFSLP